MNDDEVKALRPLVLRTYLGEECQGCHRTFDTIEELSETVWWPWEKGRVGHAACYKQSTAVLTQPK